MSPIPALDTISSTFASVSCGHQPPRHRERKRYGRPRKPLLKLSSMKGSVTFLLRKRYKGRDDHSVKLLTLQPNGKQTWGLFALAPNTAENTCMAPHMPRSSPVSFT